MSTEVQETGGQSIDKFSQKARTCCPKCGELLMGHSSVLGSFCPDCDNEQQPTGGQPAPEAVVDAMVESGQVPINERDRREHWILTQPWRVNPAHDAIICEPPSWLKGSAGLIVAYCGLPVVRQQIINLHNATLHHGVEYDQRAMIHSAIRVCDGLRSALETLLLAFPAPKPQQPNTAEIDGETA